MILQNAVSSLQWERGLPEKVAARRNSRWRLRREHTFLGLDIQSNWYSNALSCLAFAPGDLFATLREETLLDRLKDTHAEVDIPRKSLSDRIRLYCRSAEAYRIEGGVMVAGRFLTKGTE